MAIPVNTLMEEAKCYLCLGVSQEKALELALLNRIAEGGAGGGSYELDMGLIGGIAFADTTIYYMGLLSANATAAFYTGGISNQWVKILKAGTVTRIIVSVRRTVGTVPSAELVLMEVRRFRPSAASDLAMTSYTLSFVPALIENDITTLINNDLQVGDYVFIQMSTPAWVTNPGTTVVNVRLFIQ